MADCLFCHGPVKDSSDHNSWYSTDSELAHALIVHSSNNAICSSNSVRFTNRNIEADSQNTHLSNPIGIVSHGDLVMRL